MPGPSTHPRRRQRTRHGHSSREDTPEVDDPQAAAQSQPATASELVQWVMMLHNYLPTSTGKRRTQRRS